MLGPRGGIGFRSKPVSPGKHVVGMHRAVAPAGGV
jgi:hypothetical protein